MGLSFHLRRLVKCATDTVVTGQATFIPKNERTPYPSTSSPIRLKTKIQMKITTEVLNRIAKMKSIALSAMAVVALASTPAVAASFFFSTGITDGKLGALSRRPSPGKIETETADDFQLKETTAITGATITGLLPAGTPLENISNVEVELYHIFPQDSAFPPSGNVPSRVNSPADVEIGSATRDANLRTLTFTSSVLSGSFLVQNTVVNRIQTKTGGDGSITGEEVEIGIQFTSPIILPKGDYFFRPEVLLAADSAFDFLYLSAPRPIVSGTPFGTDRQAWIRNSNLAPDWLRIGTDIIDGATPPTFNMTFSLTGETIPDAGTPGAANCQGKTISALAHQFGSIDAASSVLGASSVAALQEAVRLFSEP